MLNDENRAGIEAELKWSSWAPILLLLALAVLLVVFQTPSPLAPASGAAAPMSGKSAR